MILFELDQNSVESQSRWVDRDGSERVRRGRVGILLQVDFQV